MTPLAGFGHANPYASTLQHAASYTPTCFEREKQWWSSAHSKYINCSIFDAVLHNGSARTIAHKVALASRLQVRSYLNLLIQLYRNKWKKGKLERGTDLVRCHSMEWLEKMLNRKRGHFLREETRSFVDKDMDNDILRNVTILEGIDHDDGRVWEEPGYTQIVA